MWIGVAALGAAGSLGRVLVHRAVEERASSGFPFGTLAVNISGAFVLGVFVGLALTGQALLLAGTATIGSYTTFSAWMLDTHTLRERGQRLTIIANVLVSVVVGLAALALGRALGRML